MFVKSLKLTQFRNYETGNILFHPQFNALTGLNGMGKTNILDAVYYLCIGKSYFSAGDRYVIKNDAEFFRIEGEFNYNSQKEIVVIKSQQNNKKDIEVSGKKITKISDHIGQFLCVIIAPADIQTLLDGSEARRNFINNTLVQTNRQYLNDLLLYSNLLKRRNALLKLFIEQRNFNALLLDSITQKMFEPALRIYECRKIHIVQMMEIFSKNYADISGNQEDCAIEYQSHLDEGELSELMQNNLAKDRILGRTSKGIHKDDLTFKMNGEALKNYASQGQLKSFVLSLKLTQYKLLEANSGKKPILLLDDIFDKLDQNRVKHLLKLLKEDFYGQIIITDTNNERVKRIFDEIKTGYHIFDVVNGSISEQKS